MPDIVFYRDERLPFFEIKSCNTKSLSYKKHSHEEYSIGVVEKGTSLLWCEGRETVISPESMSVTHPKE